MGVQEQHQLWGGETDKAVENFPISGEGIPVTVVRWLARIKAQAARVNAEVFAAFGANILVLFQIFLPDDLPATFTLHPQPFGAHLLFARSVKITGLSFEPSHKTD